MKIALMPSADGSLTGIWYYCPGCKDLHRVWVRAEHPRWEFNGDVQSPSFTPSVKVTVGGRVTPPYVCHHFVTIGRILFCTDSTHELSGKTVDLPDIPADFVDDWDLKPYAPQN